MAKDNTVTITGNTTREPEQRFTPAGNSVTNFGIAVNRRTFNKQTKQCADQPCEHPAGTPWTFLWCADHDARRLLHVNVMGESQ